MKQPTKLTFFCAALQIKRTIELLADQLVHELKSARIFSTL